MPKRNFGSHVPKAPKKTLKAVLKWSELSPSERSSFEVLTKQVSPLSYKDAQLLAEDLLNRHRK